MTEQSPKNEKLEAGIRLRNDPRLIAQLFFFDQIAVTTVEKTKGVHLTTIQRCIDKLGSEYISIRNGIITVNVKDPVQFENRIASLDLRNSTKNQSQCHNPEILSDRDLIERLKRDRK